MKRFFSILLGVVLFGFIGFFVASGLSIFYELTVAKSQADMDTFAVFLVVLVWPTFLVVGGVLGNLFYKQGKI